jgi:D-methionine transport system ATP-binding protein
MSPVISTADLRKVYRVRGREVTALDGVDLHVREGEVYGVVGTSGAGKSTLIRCVNMLERPTAGTVTVDGVELTALAGRGPRAGRELRAARRRIGMVFQHFNLLSSRTVQENVELPLEITGLDRRERRRRAAELLDLVGLGDKAGAHPAQLSGGQKQRVGIARALAGDPKVLLSDEATSALDPETTRSILELLRDLNRQLGLTVLLITHEMEVIKAVCDSAALMRGGRVVESGRLADLLATPGSELAHALFPLGDLPHTGRLHLPAGPHLQRGPQHPRRGRGDGGRPPGGPDAGRTPRLLRGERGPHRLSARAGPAGRPGDPDGGGGMTRDEMQPLLQTATRETFSMVGLATLVSLLAGLPLGVLLVLTDRGGLLQNRTVNKVVAAVVNVGRSLPFIILMLALTSFTRWVVGTTLGWQAATVPLAVGAVPFYARLAENAVREVDGGLVDAVQAMGGSTWAVVRKALLPEALPSLLAGLTTTVIAVIGYSAMAGTVGGGGLGTLAYTYGYMRFETDFMVVIVVELVVLVTLVQLVGDLAVRSLGHRGGGGPAPLRLLRRRGALAGGVVPPAAQEPGGSRVSDPAAR